MTGLPTDVIVMPMQAPDPEELCKHSRPEDMYRIDDQRYDALRVLGRYVHNRKHLGGSWWEWFRLRHDETLELLQDHWPVVERLAERFLTVEPDHIDPSSGLPTGRVDGATVLGWCREAEAPVFDSNVTSISY